MRDAWKDEGGIMKDEEEIPLMLRFLFGEAPRGDAVLPKSRRGKLASPSWASERLMRWCQAYEDWLEERKERYGANTIKQSKLAWKRVLQEQKRMPWELREADIEGHARWMQAVGYSPATISNALGIIANFYRWCSEQVDRSAAGLTRRRRQSDRGAALPEVKLLSQGSGPAGADDTSDLSALGSGTTRHAGAPGGAAEKPAPRDRAGAEGVARWREADEQGCQMRSGRRSGRRWKRAGG
jgi:hypothetical protein